jgi:hypothetical protein
MSALFPALLLRARSLRRHALLALILVAPIALLADTSSAPRSAPTSSCYCHCAVSHARSGCAKMCELPKYASRWWANSCAKPRRLAPKENPGASPRLPHPDRAEHAQL